MAALRNPEYISHPNEVIVLRLKTMRYVARPTRREVAMKGVRVGGSVMFGIAQSALR